MAFFNDIESNSEGLQHPIWGALLLIKDNLERMILLNIGWSLQLLPAVLALAFPALPIWLRLLLLIYTSLVLALATGTLYALVARACQGEELNAALVRTELRRFVRPSLRSLAPLYGIIALLLWIVILVPAWILLVSSTAQLMLLLLLLCSTYWGPLIVDQPELSVFAVLRRSAWLFWRYPMPTLLTDAAILIAALLGTVSIGGIFLIIPVVIVTLQMQRYQGLAARQRYTEKVQRKGKKNDE